MFDVRYSTKLKKDFKICVKRHYKMEQLQQIIDILRIPDSLPPQNSDHNLTGNHIGYRESHIASDWLLISQESFTDKNIANHFNGVPQKQGTPIFF